MSKNKSTEKAHATYGPSSAERWLACPGSIQLTEKAPPAPSNASADEGNEAHDCLEAFFVAGEKAATGTEMKLSLKHPEEMVGHAFQSYKTILTMRPKGEHQIFAEQKVDISPFTTDEQFGTCDAAIVQEFAKLTVVDFKYGVHPVEPKDNKQMILYALGLAHQFDYNFEEVEMVIVQPRCEHKSGAVRKWCITMDELLKWAPVFRAGVKACEAKNPKIVPDEDGYGHCRYCPGKVICPAVSTKAMEKAKIAFSQEETLPVVRSVPLIMGKLTAPQLGEALSAASRLKLWVESLEAHVADLLRKGQKVPGWALEPKRPSLKYSHIPSARKAAMMLLGKNALTPLTLKSPAQIRDALEENNFNSEPFLKKHTVSVSSGMNLVTTKPKGEMKNGKDKK